jgi:hypothetical protein
MLSTYLQGDGEEAESGFHHSVERQGVGSKRSRIASIIGTLRGKRSNLKSSPSEPMPPLPPSPSSQTFPPFVSSSATHSSLSLSLVGVGELLKQKMRGRRGRTDTMESSCSSMSVSASASASAEGGEAEGSVVGSVKSSGERLGKGLSRWRLGLGLKQLSAGGGVSGERSFVI